MKSRIFYVIPVAAFVLAFVYAEFFSAQKEEWTAPPEADKLENPLKNNAAASTDGKELYDQMCLVCHGKEGKGDGPSGSRPPSLLMARVRQQSDGALFWKISNGKPPMGAYKNTLSQIQIWQLVNYIRNLQTNNIAFVK